MKKKEIKYSEALQVLERGKSVECQISSREDDVEIVHNKVRLSYLYELSKEGTQLCKIYAIVQKNSNLRENIIEISFDEAYEMVHAEEIVYYKEDGEEEEITTIQELIKIRREFELKGKELLLYWYE